MIQSVALDILKTGVNVFLTGEPGSGKTHTINNYIEYLRDHGIDPAVTASTGIAATHIGGMTIHSFCGIGIKEELSPYDLEDLTQRESLVKRARNTEVLIIEEVSMLDARVIDMVDLAMKTLRGDERPFGGVQVVFVGDFYQLPPVGRSTVFAFESRAWAEAKPLTCYLSEQHRQSDDVFLEILSSIRNRRVGHSHHKHLASRKTKETSGVATKLFSHNEDVDRINDEELKRLPGKRKTFAMNTKGSGGLVEQLKRGCLSPEKLEIKAGAVVMFTKNSFERGFVNGTIGEVIDFTTAGWPLVRTKDGSEIEVDPHDWNIEDNGKIKATITQIPLRLAWAITVHKSQGMSLDSAIVDLTRAFEYGQGYVALSRVRTLDGLHLLGINERAFEVHPHVSGKDAWFRSHSGAAEGRFVELTSDELKALHTNFIVGIGGSEEVVKRDMEQKDTYEETRELLLEGKGINQIAKERSKTPSTIFKHVEKLFRENKITADDIRHLWEDSGHGDDDLKAIHRAFKKLDTERLIPVYKELNEVYEFNELRLAKMLK